MVSLNQMACFALFISLISPAYIFLQGVEVDPIILSQVQVACDRLQRTLQTTYGTASANSVNYYIRTYAADFFLKKLSAQPNIAQYNNIIEGGNSTVNGNRNMIIGNNANVNGNSNYVFSNTYANKAGVPTENSLILDEWLIKLALLSDSKYYSNPKSFIYRH